MTSAADDAIGALNLVHVAGQTEKVRRVERAGVTARDLQAFKIEANAETELADPTGGPGPMGSWTARQRDGYLNMVGALGAALDERAVRPSDPRIAEELRLAERQSSATPGKRGDAWMAPGVQGAPSTRTCAVSWGDRADRSAFAGVLFQTESELNVETHDHPRPLSAMIDARFVGASVVMPGRSLYRGLFANRLYPTDDQNVHVPYVALTARQRGVLCALDEHAMVLELVEWMRTQTDLTVEKLATRARISHGLSPHAIVLRTDGALEYVFSLDIDARRFVSVRLAYSPAPRKLFDVALSELIADKSSEAERQAESDAKVTIGEKGESAALEARMAHMSANRGLIADATFGNLKFLALGPDARDAIAAKSNVPDLKEACALAKQHAAAAMATIDGRLLARSAVLVVFDARHAPSLQSMAVSYAYHFFVPCQCDIDTKWLKRYAVAYDHAAKLANIQTCFRRVDLSSAEMHERRKSTLRGTSEERELRRSRRRMRRMARSNSEQRARDANAGRSKAKVESAAEAFQNAVWPQTQPN